jgi:multidrug resistance efflux pump
MSSLPAENRSPLSRGAKIRPLETRHALSGPGVPPETDFTASAQLAYLKAAVNEWQTADRPVRSDEGEDAKAQSQGHPAARLALKKSPIIKSAIAIALALGLGWLPVQRLLATTSAEAVVNARIITIRAPIEGEVTMAQPATDIGTSFRAEENIMSIRNPRADSVHLTNLMKERDELRTTIAALNAKKALLHSTLLELNAQQERFRLGRIAQLNQRVRESEADIASAEAQLSVASQAMKRASSLKKTDAVSQAFLDKAEGDERVARQAMLAHMEHKKGILVELDAAKNGTFVGDSYNDTPQSAQRKMEVSLELSDVEARLTGSEAQLQAMETAISAEKSRQNEISHTAIRSIVNGRVWEMLTAPGEHVNAGQDLMKVLDCGSAIVTASVSATTYERLEIGQPATFTPRDGGPELTGLIVGLNGLAAMESNTAIQQSALSREPYHVTLKFPELSKTFDCRVGRSGLVKFAAGGSVFAGSTN